MIESVLWTHGLTKAQTLARVPSYKLTLLAFGGGLCPKFELTQAFMHVLVTCKNEDALIKMKGLEWSQHCSHYKSMGIFPDAQGQLTPQSWPNFELICTLLVVLITCKNEEDPIKNEGARVLRTFSPL